ncbi:MAG: PorP/SprF family type IX secretion system membrane protein [Bacteroidota bacterium]
MKRALLGFLLAILCYSAQAQDPHFSQFSAVPSRLSPALGGVYEGSFRFAAVYRNQWSSVLGGNAFNTAAASFDARFFGARNDFFSAGIAVMSDRAGEVQLSQNQVHFTFSYLKQLSGNPRIGFAQYLVAGVQGGIGQQTVNFGDARFSLQFDGDAFNPDLPTGENFGENSNSYVDFNAGLMWYGLFGDRRSMYFGGTIHHINQPDVSFSNNLSEPLFAKFGVHGGGELPLGDQLSVLPGFLAMKQGPSIEFMAGGNLRLLRGNDYGDVAIRAGLWGRVVGKTGEFLGTDAAIVSFGLEYLSWTLQGSYDINTSTLEAASDNRGAFEVTLIYVSPSKRRGELVCPKF